MGRSPCTLPGLLRSFVPVAIAPSGCKHGKEGSNSVSQLAMAWRITPATGTFTFIVERKLVYDRQRAMLTQRRSETEVS